MFVWSTIDLWLAVIFKAYSVKWQAAEWVYCLAHYCIGSTSSKLAAWWAWACAWPDVRQCDMTLVYCVPDSLLLLKPILSVKWQQSGFRVCLAQYHREMHLVKWQLNWLGSCLIWHREGHSVSRQPLGLERVWLGINVSPNFWRTDCS